MSEKATTNGSFGGDDSSRENLLARIGEIEKRMRELEDKLVRSYESMVKVHETIASQTRWLLGVFALLLTILVGSSFVSIWSFQERANAQIVEANLKLQGAITSEIQDIRKHIENRIANFTLDWGSRVEQLENEVKRLKEELGR
ncbi:hypothetical protein [Thermus caliditerrae]|uniref:hypothetical protein n=1 Tax=Thermus caliditerrae TaxID=1330700 RepID=UPI001F26A9EE|nr:hypothetical protein [Thermus caliditerrae]